MKVITSDPEVRHLIELIAETVLSNGGYIHPELVVNHRGASLWISLPRDVNPCADDGLDRPHPQAPPMLTIPNDLHIPVTNLDWVPSDTHLAYRSSASHLTEPQKTILDAMVTLFNTIDKVREIGRSYAQHILNPTDPEPADPELLALILEARPGFARQPTAPQNSYGTLTGNSPAHIIVKSRLRSEMGEGDEGPLGFFMPMIDMLNHHPYGSRYERTDNKAWLIRTHHPTPTDEVFVRYNKADALGVALGLGYFEPDTRFVASVACEIDLSPIGKVRVRGMSATRRHLPTPRLERTPDGLALRGLVLETNRRDALRVLVAMPLRSLLPNASPTQIDDLADSLLNRIAAANIDFYTRLAALCAQPAQPGQYPLRPLMARVAERQLELLRVILGAAGDAAPPT